MAGQGMGTNPGKLVKEYVMASNGNQFKRHYLIQSQCKVLICFVQDTYIIFLWNYVWHMSVGGKIPAESSQLRECGTGHCTRVTFRES